MTKREYLESLGYLTNQFAAVNLLWKIYNGFACFINLRHSKFYIDWTNDYIDSQEDIDNLQIAFNNLRRDFEEMQKYED